MRKIMAVCLATILLFLSIPANVFALEPPIYPAPIFRCKEELVNWLETADAIQFHGGNFRNVLPQVRERGEILLPVITNDKITFQAVEVLRFAQRGATLLMRYMTPEGQLVIRIEEIDPRFAFEYDRGGIEAYFTAMDNARYERALASYLQWGGIPMPSSGEYMQRPWRNDNFQVQQKQITLRDVATREHIEHEISYIHVDNPREGNFNFSFFILNGFAIRVQYVHHLPEISGFLGGLDWEIIQIRYEDSWDEIRIFLNGERLTFDVPPQIIEGRTMVPMRAVFEALSAPVRWEDNRQMIFTSCDRYSIMLQIGNPQVTFWTRSENAGAGEIVAEYDFYIELDVPPKIIGGRTLVPLRAVSEIFGADVKWDSDSRTVNIRMS